MNKKSKQKLDSINQKCISQLYKSKTLMNRKLLKYTRPKKIAIKDKNNQMNNQINLESRESYTEIHYPINKKQYFSVISNQNIQ